MSYVVGHIVLIPSLNNSACVRQVPKPLLVQAPFPELAIKAVEKSVLGRLARLDKLQPDLLTTRPQEQRFAGQLRPVVANDGLR